MADTANTPTTPVQEPVQAEALTNSTPDGTNPVEPPQAVPEALYRRKDVEARQARMRKRLDTILTHIQAHGTVQLPSISCTHNLSPRLTSHYLQILVKQGKIRAAGHTSTRHYFI